MKYYNVIVIPAMILLLSGCGPKMEAQSLAGRIVTVENKDTDSFTIIKMTANNSESWSCVDTGGHTLSPGESATATFVTCGDIKSLKVQTNKGSKTFSWD